jgi:hypothetical protein
MKPSEVLNYVITGYKARTPTFIWGPPGVGKSDVVRQAREVLDVNLIDQRLSQMDPTDLKGIPFNNKGYTDYAIPNFLPRVERDGPNGILFLDELNTAPQSIQAAGYQLILDRRLGDYVLPEGWMCVAAGNRAEDRAIAIRLSTAMGTRFGHIDFDVDNTEWRLWAYKNNIDGDIISFMNFRPKLLHDMDVKQRTFPTPRTWEMLNKHIPFLTPETEYNTYMSFIGEGAAGEFSAYKKMARELPDIDAILAEPEHIKVPKKPSTQYAAAGILTEHVTVDNFSTLMKYAVRLPIEHQTVFISDAISKDDELENTPEFTKWALDNNNVIL